MAYGDLGTNSMVYQNRGGGLQVLPLWSESMGYNDYSAIGYPVKPMWVDDSGSFRLFDWFNGAYIPLSGSDQIYGDLVPTSSGTINLGSSTYRYNTIYVNYVTSSGANITNIYSSQITSSDANITNIYSSQITSSGANITNVYASQITSSVIESTFYDTSSTGIGFAYFDVTTHKLIDGGDIYNLPSWVIESSSIAYKLDNHNHYITHSILVGNTPDGGTNSLDMFLQGNNGIDSNPFWTYLVPSYIKSSSDLTPLAGPSVLVSDSDTDYTYGKWVTGEVNNTASKVLGIKKGESTFSYLTFEEGLDLTKYAALIGNGTDPIHCASPSTAGQALVSNGANDYPSFGVVNTNGGGTGLIATAYTKGSIIYAGSDNATTLSVLPIGSTSGSVLSSYNGVPTWNNMSTLTLTGEGLRVLGTYNPTGSDKSIAILADDIGAASKYHSHSANDIVSGQLAIARIPTGTSYDTVALGNHTHANLNLTVGTTTVTYNGGTEVDFIVTAEDIQDTLGVVPVSHGGTGLTSIGIGVLVAGTNTETMSYIAPGTAGYALVSNGTNVNPSYQILPGAGGGTGFGSYTKGDILYAAADGSNLSKLHTGSNGQALVLTNGVPSWQNTVISSSYAINAFQALSSSFSTNAKNAQTASYAPLYIPLAGTNDLTGPINPSVAGSIDLGSSTKYYNNIYATNFIGTASYATIANRAEQLRYPRYFSIIGGITADGEAFDGTEDVALNVTEIDPNYITGEIPLDKIPTGSYNNWIANTFIGDLDGTASRAITSSYAIITDTAISASYAELTDTAISSSYADNAFYSIYANATERLLTPFKISIHGAATAEAQYVDGQTDVQLNVFELDANFLYGKVPFETLPVGTSSTTVAQGDHTHKDLSVNVMSGTTSTTTTYNGGTVQSVDVNEGTFQLITNSATIAQSSNLYHNHTVMYDARSKTTGTVTMPTTITNIKIGDKITIKCVSDNANFQYTVTLGTAHSAINRKGDTETIYGSYGVDLVFTCIAKTSSLCTWVYEKQPVSFN